jgi:signal peptidase I
MEEPQTLNEPVPGIEFGETPLPALQERAPRRGTWLLMLLREAGETILLALIIFLLVNSVVRNFKIKGQSMEPTLQDGQFVVVDKISYRLHSPERGDIIVFEPPFDAENDYIKRVIGLPGEIIEVRDGTVYVDNRPLDEPYIREKPRYGMAPTKVQPDTLLVLGDNRNNSSDSFRWGLLAMDRVIGKALVRYWPLDAFGTLPHHRFDF